MRISALLVNSDSADTFPPSQRFIQVIFVFLIFLWSFRSSRTAVSENPTVHEIHWLLKFDLLFL